MKNCYVRKLKAVVNNSELPILTENVTLYDTTISAGTQFNIDLPVGTEVYVSIENVSGVQTYLQVVQQDSNNSNLATVISGMALNPGLTKKATTSIVEGCAKFNVTVDTGKSNKVWIGYSKSI